MVKTTVYLDSDTVLALRQMAETQGRSQADLIRDALQAYARKGKRPLPAGLGKYDSGEPMSPLAPKISFATRPAEADGADRGFWRSLRPL